MRGDNIKTGDRIEISNKKEDWGGKFYISQVEQVLEDGKILVHVPISYGHLVMLPIGVEYSFLFFTDKGMINHEAKVLSHLKDGGFNMMQIELTTDAKRVQRREFFRFDATFSIKFGLLGDDYDPKTNTPPPVMFEGIVKDISAGGVRFVTNYEINEADKIKCVIMLKSICVNTLGKILHKQEFRQSPYKFQYRVVFLGMSSGEREKIVQFIFKEQRRVIQRS